MKTKLIISFVILLIVLIFTLIIVYFSGAHADYSMEINRSDNTFTLLGKCEGHRGANCQRPDRLRKMKNIVARRAGVICFQNGMKTDSVAKLGDQRVIVICK